MQKRHFDNSPMFLHHLQRVPDQTFRKNQFGPGLNMCCLKTLDKAVAKAKHPAGQIPSPQRLATLLDGAGYLFAQKLIKIFQILKMEC